MPTHLSIQRVPFSRATYTIIDFKYYIFKTCLICPCRWSLYGSRLSVKGEHTSGELFKVWEFITLQLTTHIALSAKVCDQARSSALSNIPGHLHSLGSSYGFQGINKVTQLLLMLS